jgi:hypothetical protein
MRRYVALVTTDVSEERNAFIKVTRIGELGTWSKLSVTANVVPSSLILSTLMMGATRSFETSIVTRVTRRLIPEDFNFKFYIALTDLTLYWRRNVSPVKYELEFYNQETTFFIVTAVKTSNLTWH